MFHRYSLMLVCFDLVIVIHGLWWLLELEIHLLVLLQTHQAVVRSSQRSTDSIRILLLQVWMLLTHHDPVLNLLVEFISVELIQLLDLSHAVFKLLLLLRIVYKNPTTVYCLWILNALVLYIVVIAVLLVIAGNLINLMTVKIIVNRDGSFARIELRLVSVLCGSLSGLSGWLLILMFVFGHTGDNPLIKFILLSLCTLRVVIVVLLFLNDLSQVTWRVFKHLLFIGSHSPFSDNVLRPLWLVVILRLQTTQVKASTHTLTNGFLDSKWLRLSFVCKFSLINAL